MVTSLPQLPQHNTCFHKDIMFQVILMGFLQTDNGHSCEFHIFRCSNALHWCWSENLMALGCRISFGWLKEVVLLGIKVKTMGPTRGAMYNLA